MRQLARVNAVSYRETLWSDLFPGNQLTMQCLQQAVLAVESSFELAPEMRKRTLYRLDGGSGTDENLRQLLARDYQLLGKGFSGKRAKALAARVSRWDAYDDQSWLGWVDPTFDLGRPIQAMVKRRLHKGKLKHSYYVTTLSFPSKRAFMNRYNQRGGAEIEQFRDDKSGLHLSARRERSFAAQKALIFSPTWPIISWPIFTAALWPIRASPIGDVNVSSVICWKFQVGSISVPDNSNESKYWLRIRTLMN